jgi:multicomponent K+:H+ antiporter subunit E
LQPCFADIPLDLRGELPRFLLACLISMTPGSMTVGLDQQNNLLSVHFLDAPDTAAAIAEIKTVLEEPLIRIFGRI